MIVLDDLMATAAKDPRITYLFSEGSHHKNLSVVVLNQDLYYSKDPTQRRNCQYQVLFKNPVDKQQIITLGRQMYPGKVPYFLQKFEEATARDYGHLLLDLKPTTSESNRLRSNVLDKKQEDDVISMTNGIRIKEQEDNVHSLKINRVNRRANLCLPVMIVEWCSTVCMIYRDISRRGVLKANL